MKFSVVLVSIGALCLSSVEALKKTHKYEWQPPCEEDDV
jgi:hypothetical protein